MWENTVEPGRPQMAIWRMRIACLTPKTTNTQSEYVILIALPLQQWSRERTPRNNEVRALHSVAKKDGGCDCGNMAQALCMVDT
jgi:hypothetical protein